MSQAVVPAQFELPSADPKIPLYPLKFEPIYQYRPWGGRRLESLVNYPLPLGLVGKAWILSDRDEHPSLVTLGPLKGKTIKQLLHASRA